MKHLLFITMLALSANALALSPKVCTTNYTYASEYLALAYKDVTSTIELPNKLKQSIEAKLPSKNILNYDLDGIRADFTESGWLVSIKYQAKDNNQTMFVSVRMQQDCASGKPVYVIDQNTKQVITKVRFK